MHSRSSWTLSVPCRILYGAAPTSCSVLLFFSVSRIVRSQALRVRLTDTETARRHTKEMLEASRSSGLVTGERAEDLRGKAETAKVMARGYCSTVVL